MRRRGIPPFVVVLALVVGLAGCARKPRAQAAQAGTLTIRFIDVGQGDAALVITPDHRAILIDAGPDRTAVADRLPVLLHAGGATGLALAVGSHAHADHIGGMAAAVTAVPTENYLDNGRPYTTATYRRTLDALQAKHVRVLGAPVGTAPRTLTVGAVTVEILPLPPGDDPNENERSVGLVLTYGQFRAFFTGDAEEEERGYWMDHRLVPAGVQLLKVAHHGSHNGTDPAWLAVVRPQLGVISLGNPNDYGHPHQAALDALAAAHVRVLRTDRVGDVVVTADSSGSFQVATAHAPVAGAVPDAGRAPPASAPSRPRPRRRSRARRTATSPGVSHGSFFVVVAPPAVGASVDARHLAHSAPAGPSTR